MSIDVQEKSSKKFPRIDELAGILPRAESKTTGDHEVCSLDRRLAGALADEFVTEK